MKIGLISNGQGLLVGIATAAGIVFVIQQ